MKILFEGKLHDNISEIDSTKITKINRPKFLFEIKEVIGLACEDIFVPVKILDWAERKKAFINRKVAKYIKASLKS